jgi:inorganic pyrophosphatase
MLDNLRAPADPLSVIIEVPRGGHIKRALDAQGQVSGVQLLSPLPCPFNYGCAPSIDGQDGDPLDAIVLGPALRLGDRLTLPVVGVVRFMDRGAVDDKWILSATPPTWADDRALRRFFGLYAWAKRLVNVLRRERGETSLRGVEWRIPPLSSPDLK